MNIIYRSLKRFQGMLEAIYHNLGGEMDFLTFQEILGKDLNQLGKDILICVLEAKSEEKDPLIGKEQARRYANSQNVRFIILSNGNISLLLG